MNPEIANLQPQPNDLVVIPHDMNCPKDMPFLTCRVKHLHKPSIVRSGSYGHVYSYTAGTPRVENKPENKLDSNPSSVLSLLDRILKAGIFQYPSFTPGKLPEFIEEPNGGGIVDMKEVSAKVGEIGKEELPKVFRYIRAKEYWLDQQEDKIEARVSPKGGVAFYIELDAEHDSFAFSYALCHEKDNFSRAHARAVTSERFDNEDWYEVEGYDSDFSLVENIRVALGKLLQLDYTCGIIAPAIDNSIKFSSLSEKMSYRELKQIFERI